MSMKRCLRVLALAAIGATVAAGSTVWATTLADTAWPMFGHDVKHTFRTNLLGPTTGDLLSVTRTGNAINSQAGVSSDGIFVNGGGGWATIGMRADGFLLWRTPVGAEGKFSTPALDTDGFFYIGARDNQLWKKEIETGLAICKRYIPTDSDIKSSPTISVKFPDRVYVTADKAIYAISVSGATPCQTLWRLPLNNFTLSSVSLADTVPGNGDSLGPLIVASGVFLYKVVDNGPSATILAQANVGYLTSGPTPLVHPSTGNIYIGNGKREFRGFAPNLGPLFTVNLDGRVFGSAALSPDGGTVYVATDRGSLYALNALDGSGRPGFPMHTSGNAYQQKVWAPVVDGAGIIYLGGRDRYMRAIWPTGPLAGTARWETKIGGQPAAATIVDGGLAFSAKDGRFYRFCPPPSGPPTATSVCGFTIDTTVP